MFDPAAFLGGMGAGQYDWADLRRLLRRGWEIQPDVIIKGVQKDYAFLQELSPDETLLAGDPYFRRNKAYHSVVAGLHNPE
jgi:hypothetical protein